MLADVQSHFALTRPPQGAGYFEIDMLSTRLRTPMQIERHMARSFEEAYRSGTRPVTAEIVDSVLSPPNRRPRADARPPWLRREGVGGSVQHASA